MTYEETLSINCIVELSKEEVLMNWRQGAMKFSVTSASLDILKSTPQGVNVLSVCIINCRFSSDYFKIASILSAEVILLCTAYWFYPYRIQ